MGKSGGVSQQQRREAYALNNQAAARLQEGRPEKALLLLRQAEEMLPEDPSILLNLGGAYLLLGQHDEAVAALTRASEVAPEEPMIWCNLGAALLALSDDRDLDGQDRAIEAFRRALELDPKAANVAYNLGLVHRQREEWGAAAHYFRKALEADPDDGHARSLLCKMERRAARESKGGEEYWEN